MNALYAGLRDRMLKGFVWQDLPLIVGAWHGAYVFDETDVTTQDVIAAGGILSAYSLPLTNVIPRTGGYARSDMALLPTMPVGAEITFLTIMEDTGVLGQEKQLMYIDEANGLPFIPNGLDQYVQPDWLDLRGWFRA